MIKAENPILIEGDCTTFDYVRSKFKGEENFKNPKKIKEWFERFNKTIHSTFFLRMNTIKSMNVQHLEMFMIF